MRRILLLPITALVGMVLASCGGFWHRGTLHINIVIPPVETARPYPGPYYAGPRVPSWLPDGAFSLVATDGRLAQAVSLSWTPGGDAPAYEVLRKSAREDAQWERIATTRDANYLDQPLPDYKLFFYRVRTLGPTGPSSWSNVDGGFAGRGEEPCEIRGDVTFPGGASAPSMRVVLVGLGDEAMRVSGADGRFSFAGLPPGRYLVAPFHPAFDFVPPYVKVDLGIRLETDVHFTALRKMPLRNLSGFVFRYVDDGSGEPQFTPMAGVTVEAVQVGQAGAPFRAVTNEDGYYNIDNLPLGAYRMQAFCGSCAFTPSYADVTVDGRNCPGRRNLVGMPMRLPIGARFGPAASKR